MLAVDKRFNHKLDSNKKLELEYDERLPAAVLEWAKLHEALQWKWRNSWMNQDGEILEYYSNNDHFWLTDLSISNAFTIPSLNKTLIEFGQENQGNFKLAFEYQTGLDNPQVYINDIPTGWNLYARSFSDFVFTQIFDWQFRLENLPEWETEIGYYEMLDIKNIDDIEIYLRHLRPEVSNEYTWMGDENRMRRYSKSDYERLILYGTDDDCSLEIFGADKMTTRNFFEEVKRNLRNK